MPKIIGIILILFYNFISCIIIIPFQTFNPLLVKNVKVLELIKNASDNEIINTISKNLIYTNLEIGERKQIITIFIEMGSNELYFKDLAIHTGLLPLNNVNNNNFSYINNYLFNIIKLNYYNSSLSKSYKYIYSCPEYLEDYFYDRDVFGKEIIYLKEKNKTTNKEEYKLIEFYINFKEYEKYDNRPGIIGFNIKNSKFIKRLKELSIIKNNNWNIKYNNFYEEKGEIIIGDLPHIYDEKNYNKDNLRYANLYNKSNYEYSLNFDDIYITLNNQNFYLEKNKITSFYIEEFFIFGTNKYFGLIEELFFKKYINEQICHKKVHKYKNIMYYFICYINDNKVREIFFNNFPSLTFYQKQMNYNFTLDSKDLFTIIPDNNRILFNIGFINNSKIWILGKPFFKKYQITSTIKSNKIIYYSNSSLNVKEIKSNEISRKLLVIIFIVFISGFLFGKIICFKYNRKIRANELEDNYSYLSNNTNNINN